jgi:hypothetical protein
LTAFTRYRQWSAALLLALYAFIAVPVQYWHTHPEERQVAAYHPADASVSASFFQAHEQLKVDCKICDHHYSAYYGDQCGQPILPQAVKNFSFQFPVPALFETVRLSCLNKGPPETA